MRMLIVDNYDSFTWNLVQLFAGLGADITVRRNDEIEVDDAGEYDCVCISPGPGRPENSGCSVDIVKKWGETLPIFGVCLGMQVINEVFGGRTVKSPAPVHGKRSLIRHKNTGLFEGLPAQFHVTRYHSLCVDSVPDQLEVDAGAQDGVIMAFHHRLFPLYGVQFHPESFLSEHGEELAARFLALCNSAKRVV